MLQGSCSPGQGSREGGTSPELGFVLFCCIESDITRGRQERVLKLSTSARKEAGQTRACKSFFPQCPRWKGSELRPRSMRLRVVPRGARD